MIVVPVPFFSVAVNVEAEASGERSIRMRIAIASYSYYNDCLQLTVVRHIFCARELEVHLFCPVEGGVCNKTVDLRLVECARLTDFYPIDIPGCRSPDNPPLIEVESRFECESFIFRNSSLDILFVRTSPPITGCSVTVTAWYCMPSLIPNARTGGRRLTPGPRPSASPRKRSRTER